MIRAMIGGICAGVVLTVLSAGCAEEPTLSKPKEQTMSRDAEKKIAYRIVAQGETPADYDLYMHGKQEISLYRSDSAQERAAYRKRYRQLTGKAAPEFEGTALIALYGRQSSGGYGFAVERIAERGDHVEALLRAVAPKPGDLVTQALTNPYIVIVLPGYFGKLEVSTAR